MGTQSANIVVEPAGYHPGLWLVRNADQVGGTIFDAPFKACVTSREAAERIAETIRSGGRY